MLTTAQWAAIARERLTPLLGAPPDPEFLDELAAHLAQAYEEARRDGRSDEEGRAAALAAARATRARGSRPRASAPGGRSPRVAMDQAGSAGPATRRLVQNGIARDIRHALRMLVRAPAFSVIADHDVRRRHRRERRGLQRRRRRAAARPLPYPDADRITMVWLDNRRENDQGRHHLVPELPRLARSEHRLPAPGRLQRDGVRADRRRRAGAADRRAGDGELLRRDGPQAAWPAGCSPPANETEGQDARRRHLARPVAAPLRRRGRRHRQDDHAQHAAARDHRRHAAGDRAGRSGAELWKPLAPSQRCARRAARSGCRSSAG